MTRALPLLACAVLAAVPIRLAAQTVTEPSSGVAFPVTLAVDGGQHTLTGVGLRTRTVLGVKVYAFGVYVDAAPARTALASFAGRDARALSRDPALYETLLRMTVPLSLRLVMTRNVTGEQMSDAFDGALRPRVVAAATRGGAMTGGEAALDRFRAFFSIERLTEGTVLTFTCNNGTLATNVAGAAQAAIQSPALCWALFDVYLGSNPISPSGKQTAVARIPDILAGR